MNGYWFENRVIEQKLYLVCPCVVERWLLNGKCHERTYQSYVMKQPHFIIASNVWVFVGARWFSSNLPHLQTGSVQTISTWFAYLHSINFACASNEPRILPKLYNFFMNKDWFSNKAFLISTSLSNSTAIHTSHYSFNHLKSQVYTDRKQFSVFVKTDLDSFVHRTQSHAKCWCVQQVAYGILKIIYLDDLKLNRSPFWLTHRMPPLLFNAISHTNYAFNLHLCNTHLYDNVWVSKICF